MENPNTQNANPKQFSNYQSPKYLKSFSFDHCDLFGTWEFGIWSLSP